MCIPKTYTLDVIFKLIPIMYLSCTSHISYLKKQIIFIIFIVAYLLNDTGKGTLTKITQCKWFTYILRICQSDIWTLLQNFGWMSSIGGSRGVLLACGPLQQDPILSFLHNFCQKAPTSEVGTPPNGSVPPQQEILDSPLSRI